MPATIYTLATAGVATVAVAAAAIPDATPWSEVASGGATIVAVALMLRYMTERDKVAQAYQQTKDEAHLQTLGRLGDTCHEVQARAIDAIMESTKATAAASATSQRNMEVLERVERSILEDRIQRGEKS